MSTHPINLVHITDRDIINGIKFHVSQEQRSKIQNMIDLYSFVNGHSGTWEITGVVNPGSDVSTISANWENTWMTVMSNSGMWALSGSEADPNVAILQSASGNWNSVLATVMSNSGMWALSGGSGGGSDVSTISSNWQNTYTTFMNYSADWISSGIFANIDNANVLYAPVNYSVSAEALQYHLKGIDDALGFATSGYLFQPGDNLQLLYSPVVGGYSPATNTVSGHLFGVNSAISNLSLDIINITGIMASGSDVSTISANWQNTWLTVMSNSGMWALSGGTGGGGSDVSTISANWQNAWLSVAANSAAWALSGGSSVTLSGGVAEYVDVATIAYVPTNYSVATADVSGHFKSVNDRLAGGTTSSSLSYFYVATDNAGTGARWVQMNTVTYNISGTSRTLFYQ